MRTSLIIGGKSNDNERSLMDFYPTPAECTHALMRFLATINVTFDKVWECACGNGAMSNILAEYVKEVVSTDIRIDTGFGIGGVDFLVSEKLADVVITNPPFNVAEKFIQKCFESETLVYAFILKSQYWHSKGRLKLFEKMKPAFVLPLTWRPNFTPERGGHHILIFIGLFGLREKRILCIYRYVNRNPKAS